MQLGAFSISLTVKDLEASRAFYEKFGFKVFGGDASKNWLILKNGDHVIGLFHGMFRKNILTFNPALRANIDETVLLVLITEQGENRNQCEEQRNIFGFSHGFACR